MTPTRSLVIEKEFAHPVEKVWRALTQGPLIKEWLMDNDFEPVTGHKFNFRFTPMANWDGIIHSEVLTMVPHEKLSYRWNTLGLETVVDWTLAATERGTLVRMEQSGFGADNDAAYKGASYGWQNFMGKLEGVVARLQ